MEACFRAIRWTGQPHGNTGPARTVFNQPEPEELLELTVIVPARNEMTNLKPATKNAVLIELAFGGCPAKTTAKTISSS